MTNAKALKLLLAMIKKERRHLRQFYDMYEKGFYTEKPGHDRYLEIVELEEKIKEVLSS